MTTTRVVIRVSSKYQITIPREVREAANIGPGTELEVRVVEHGLRLIRIPPLAKLRGSVRRDDSLILRDRCERR